jgi:hypothetical protein
VLGLDDLSWEPKTPGILDIDRTREAGKGTTPAEALLGRQHLSYPLQERG